MNTGNVNRRQGYSQFLLIILSGALLLTVPGGSGCSSNKKITLEMDALTSATPGAEAILLTSAHSAWERSECITCHDDLHTSGYGDADCANCHGSNGAPVRPLECQGAGCLTCHADANLHDGENFSPPNDCRACHEYDPAEAECTHTGDYDVVVIGAGGGGLSAAASLAREGKNVLLLEKSYKVGGQMVSMDRLDYHIEVSLHGLDFMGISTVRNLAGEDSIQPVTADPVMYRVITPDFTFDVPADSEEYRARLKEQFPDEADNIDDIFDEVGGLSSGYAGMSALEILNRYTQDEKLITILTALSIYLGVPPDQLSGSFFAMGMLTGYNQGGFNYLVGGSQSISTALAGAFEEYGGTIMVNTLATKIVIENGRATQVRTDDGGCFNTDFVVSNANGPDTYLNLIGEEYFDPAFISAMNARELGSSIFAVYLGVDYDYTEYMPEGSHEAFVYKSYDMNYHYEGIAQCDPEKTAFGYANFSVVDPTAAPPGKSAIAVVSQLGDHCFDNWGWGSSYQEYKDYKLAMAEEYIRQAEEQLPGLSEHIEVMEVATPRTVEQYTLNPRGTIFGWKSYTSDVEFIELFNLDKVSTPIPNVFLASAWAFGGGQTPVLLAGVLAASAILDQ